MSQSPLKSDAEVLQEVLDIIQPQEAWCKGAFFRDEDGVSSEPEMATSYCLEGAMQAATGQVVYKLQGDMDSYNAADEQINRLRKHLVGIMHRENISSAGSIPSFNDHAETTKEDALHLVKLGLAEADSIPSPA